MILLDHVSFEYEKGNKTLDDITFEIKEGQSVGLIGANGAGKSTLMKLLLGLIPHGGSVNVAGMELNAKNLAEIRRKMGFVLQNSDNQMFMPTVFEDIIFAPMNYGMNKEDAEKAADSVLEALGLTDIKHRHNHKLSGGEKRMAAIATVLAMNPDIILMDEPTSALDPYNRRKIINIINSFDKTKVITSHDLDMILDTCDRVIFLSEGKVVADGSAEEILSNKELLEAHRMELPLSLQKQ